VGSRLEKWVALLANLGVLGGLLFVGLELRQNTSQLRSDASHALTERVNEMNAGVYGDPSLAEILLRGEEDLGALTPVERSRFELYQFARINVAEYAIDLEEEGLSGVNFRFVEFLEGQYATKPGLRQFAESMAPMWVGSDELLARLLGS